MLQEFHGFPIEDFDIQQDVREDGLLRVKVTHLPTRVTEIHCYHEDVNPLMAELGTFLSLIGCLESITSIHGKEPPSLTCH